jgi:predicted DNA binding CopG/RHH family protein
MKKTLPLAKAPLPKFRSDKEAAKYLETHSVTTVWDRLPKGESAKPSAALAKSIRERHKQAKAPISLRLAPEQIEAAKKIAAAKSVGYQTQLRMWIAEGIRREEQRRYGGTKVDRSGIFNLGNSGGSNIARNKDEMIGQALAGIRPRRKRPRA